MAPKEASMTIKIVGELEVDIERGVIYFHNYTNGISNLRICGLRERTADFTVKSQLDITIPVVMRCEMPKETHRVPVKVTSFAPKNFFLGDDQTTHISKAQARKERMEHKRKLAEIKKETRKLGKVAWKAFDGKFSKKQANNLKKAFTSPKRYST